MPEETKSPDRPDAPTHLEPEGSEAEARPVDARTRSKAAEEAAHLAEEFLQQLSRGDAGLGELEVADGIEADLSGAPETAALHEADTDEVHHESGESPRERRARRRAETLEMVAKIERRALEAEARVAELTKEAEGHYEARLRLQADFENLRKRVQREREEQARFAHEDLLKELLPTIDNLQRAVQHAESEGGSGPLLDGVNITLNQFLHVLSRFGVTPFDSAGEPFDPQLHDAMSQVPTDEMEPNRVATEFVKGYRYRERLLRPAMVAVSMAPPQAAAPPEAATEPGETDEQDETDETVAAAEPVTVTVPEVDDTPTERVEAGVGTDGDEGPTSDEEDA